MYTHCTPGSRLWLGSNLPKSSLRFDAVIQPHEGFAANSKIAPATPFFQGVRCMYAFFLPQVLPEARQKARMLRSVWEAVAGARGWINSIGGDEGRKGRRQAGRDITNTRPNAEKNNNAKQLSNGGISMLRAFPSHYFAFSVREPADTGHNQHSADTAFA